MSAKKRFGLQRKLVAAATSGEWRNAPLMSVLYEADVTRLIGVLREINAGRSTGDAISFNTVILKIIAEGIKACPKMNGHIHYNNFLARGKVTTFDSIDVTMPVLLGQNNTMSLNIRGVEDMSLSDIRDAVSGAIRRARNSHMPQVMYELALHDTMKELRHFHVFKALGRFIGLLLDGSTKELLHGKAKREYKQIPAEERLSWRDLEQGTITVTNPGTLLRSCNGRCVLMTIIPPAIAAVAVNNVLDKPLVGKDGTIRPGKTVELTVIFDHRALDGADLVPFFRCLDKIFASPEVLTEYL